MQILFNVNNKLSGVVLLKTIFFEAVANIYFNNSIIMSIIINNNIR